MADHFRRGDGDWKDDQRLKKPRPMEEAAATAADAKAADGKAPDGKAPDGKTPDGKAPDAKGAGDAKRPMPVDRNAGRPPDGKAPGG